MNELASLIIKVDTQGPSEANKELTILTKTAGQAEKATGGLFSAFKRLLGPLLAVVSVTAGLNKLVQTAKTFESLNAQLKTATGSAENAALAFEAVQDFARNTPYDLAQTTEAFIKLVNMGLTPSERALKSYGDTSSAMGKQISQMIEAVADAATGEFERLKEFGIKARTEGDQIAFKFKGVTTRVKNDAASIEEYLIKLGETNFAGAMTERMGTLEGKLSNLGDAWDQLFATIAKAGAGEAITAAIDMALRAIESLTAAFASGQIQGYIDAFANRFVKLGSEIADDFSFIKDFVQETFKKMGGDANTVVKFIVDAFMYLPERVYAFIKIAGATIGTLVSYAESTARAIYDTMVAWFGFLVETSKNIGAEIAANLNPFDDNENDFVAKQKAAYAEVGAAATAAFAQRSKEIDAARDAYLEYTNGVIDGTMAVESAFKKEISAADMLRKKYEETQAAKAEAQKNNPTDRLEQFSQANKGPAGATSQQRTQFESLLKSLQIEEKAIADSYAKRLELIKVNTEAGSDLQLELIANLERNVTQEYENAFIERFERLGDLQERMNEAVAEGRMTEYYSLVEQLRLEEEEIMRSYEFRANQILSDTKLTEEQKYALLEELNAKYTAREAELLKQKNTQTIKSAESLFSSLADISATMAGKQSGVYKAMFAMSKAFAIADAIVKIQQGIAAAAATPWPANIAAMASVAAATSSILSNIQSVSLTFAGNYANGGIVGGSSYSGDNLVAKVNSDEMILNSSQQSKLWQMANGQGGSEAGGNVKVIINNNTNAVATVRESEDGDGKIVEITIEKTLSRVKDDFVRGGPLSRTLENSYGMRRGVA